MADADVYRDIGRRIRDAREAEGLTQEALARHLDLAPSAITEIEKGRRKVTITELQRLASLLNKSLTWFLTGEDAPDARTLRTPNRHIPPEAKKEVEDFIAYIWEKYQTRE